MGRMKGWGSSRCWVGQGLKRRVLGGGSEAQGAWGRAVVQGAGLGGRGGLRGVKDTFTEFHSSLPPSRLLRARRPA